jgi:hypothetical protein
MSRYVPSLFLPPAETGHENEPEKCGVNALRELCSFFEPSSAAPALWRTHGAVDKTIAKNRMQFLKTKWRVRFINVEF